MKPTLDLPDAMRAGAAMRPQISCTLFGMLPTGEIGSCALGAALEGGGFATVREMDIKHRATPRDAWPRWQKIITSCPEHVTSFMCGLDYDGIAIIPHLNNPPHNWTRERIADYLDQLKQDKQQAESLIQASTQPVPDTEPEPEPEPAPAPEPEPEAVLA